MIKPITIKEKKTTICKKDTVTIQSTTGEFAIMTCSKFVLKTIHVFRLFTVNPSYIRY
jgi:hypothetical protein